MIKNVEPWSDNANHQSIVVASLSIEMKCDEEREQYRRRNYVVIERIREGQL